MQNLFKNTKGTALLVALLVMGVFITVSLALSSLIFRELRVTRDFLDSGRAYYAAESGVEIALYELNDNLPGWEPLPDDENGYSFLKFEDDYRVFSEYKVDNRCNAYPCYNDENFLISDLDDLSVYYDVLELNEAISIPLFVVEEDEFGVVHEVPVRNFTVEFFAPFEPSRDFEINVVDDFDLTGWDILRWKIFGLHKETKVTQTISDFTAISKVRNSGVDEENLGNVAEFPSWFGTVACDTFAADSRYSEFIDCAQYSTQTGAVEFFAEDNKSPIYAVVCSNTQAREYYHYGFDGDIDAEDVKDCYEISDFLLEHELNYLSLTNLMNPAILKNSYSAAEKARLSKLYFRVELFGDFQDPNSNNETVREYADIIANGYSGNSKQSISVSVKRGSFMPVFNFSLYSTYEAD